MGQHLYHYTSFENWKEIEKSKSLRFTYLGKTARYERFEERKSRLVSYLTDWREGTNKPYLKSFYGEALDWCTKFKEKNIDERYQFCLSTSKDDSYLAQKYGKEDPVQIEFDLGVLEGNRAGETSHFYWFIMECPVEYESEGKREDLKSFVESFAESCKFRLTDENTLDFFDECDLYLCGYDKPSPDSKDKEVKLILYRAAELSKLLGERVNFGKGYCQVSFSSDVFGKLVCGWKRM